MATRFRYCIFSSLIFWGGLFSFTLKADEIPDTEKRIYILDVSPSMVGQGTLSGVKIFPIVKSNLRATIENIEDENTEVEIIPFADKVLNNNIISGKISLKDSLLLPKIESLDVDFSSKKTNIIDAWKFGVSRLDTTKVNYLFLLTDGIQNDGQKIEKLYNLLEKWEQENSYAFYIMLTKNADSEGIRKVAEKTDNMWALRTMDINACFLKTPRNLSCNVFGNKPVEISFSTNNKKADLSALRPKVSLSDNNLYSVGEDISFGPIVDSSSNKYSCSFPIEELLGHMDMPLDTTITLTITNPELPGQQEDSPSFIFFTPEKFNLKIDNFGPRRVKVLQEGNEPQGKHFILQLSANDTARVCISKDIEAIRAKAACNLDFKSENDSIRLDWKYQNDSLLLVWAVPLEGYEMTGIPGKIFAETSRIDYLNDNEVSDGSHIIGTWEWRRVPVKQIYEYEPDDESSSGFWIWFTLSIIIFFLFFILPNLPGGFVKKEDHYPVGVREKERGDTLKPDFSEREQIVKKRLRISFKLRPNLDLPKRQLYLIYPTFGLYIKKDIWHVVVHSSVPRNILPLNEKDSDMIKSGNNLWENLNRFLESSPEATSFLKEGNAREKLLARYDVLKNKVSGKEQTILSSFHIASKKTKGKFIIIFDIVSNEVLYDFVPAVFHKKDVDGVIDTLVLCSVIVTNLNTGKSLTI